MLDNTVNAGEILRMSDLQTAFESAMAANNVEDPTCSRKALKQLIQREIPGVEFHRPNKVNESERVVPISLFASDGTMLHCSLKSALMGILEKLDASQTTAPSLHSGELCSQTTESR
jgi:hypothetical protein